MSTNESEPDFEAVPAPSAANATNTAPQSTLTLPPTRKRWRKRSVLIVSAVGALVVASAATGIATTAQVSTTSQGSSTGSSGSTTTGNNARLLPQRNGSGFGRYGTNGSTSRVSDTTAATGATAAESRGIVLIDTVLKYEDAEAAGTGIILTSTGEIVTNNHVVDGATSISVTIASTGKTYTARVVGTDPTSDVAVLQLEGASGLTPATIDSKTSATTSDAVTAVGNAGGTGSLSAATGTITALDQSITASGESAGDSENLTGLIETDADVVAGDSGGPLYNASGAVIGIDTAASSGSSAVSGYAIPIAHALSIARQIESGSTASGITLGSPAFLGVEIADASSGSATQDPTGESTGASVAGATVAGVLADTPAASAGIAEGDTITAVDGTAVSSAAELTQVLATHPAGSSVTIGWTDASGAVQSATVVLIEGAAN